MNRRPILKIYKVIKSYIFYFDNFSSISSSISSNKFIFFDKANNVKPKTILTKTTVIASSKDISNTKKAIQKLITIITHAKTYKISSIFIFRTPIIFYLLLLLLYFLFLLYNLFQYI